MNLKKIREVMTISLQIAAVGLIVAIFIIVCRPVVFAESVSDVLVEETLAEDAQVEVPIEEPDAPERKLIALTFDDGPTPTVTDKILDTLEKNNAKATFFVVGRQVKQANSLVKRAVSLGCEIGNHTWEHREMTKYKVADMKRSLKRTDQVVKKYTDFEISIVRPTYGDVNKKVKENVGKPLIYWNVDSYDWKLQNAKKIYNRTTGKKVADGDIILMHDLHPATATAVEKIVPALIRQGYELVTVSELMEYKQKKMDAGKLYYSGR